MQDTSSKNKARHYAESSSFKMAILFTLLCGAAVIVLGYFSYYFNRGHFIDGTEAVIDTEIKYIDSVGSSDLIAMDPDEGRIYEFFGDDGGRPDALPNSVSTLSEGIIVFDHPENSKTYAAKIHTFKDGRKLLVGFDITHTAEDYEFMQNLSVLSIVLMIGVILTSYFLSAFVVKGTNKIAKDAQEIMDTGDLSRRLEVSSKWDDLGHMTLVLNNMLGRIEDLLQGVRQVSDNIAHDLRTPLTRMRNKIEEMKKHGHHPAFDELLEEADHLLNTFNALLRITRIESEKKCDQFKDIDLQEMISDVTAFYEPLAEEKNISLEANLQDAQIHGDRDLLFQAYANILDNAIKFTPNGGSVNIKLFKDNEKFRIEILDSGAGICEEEREKIFDRFYRGEKCRGSSGGTGLGLSLVAAVIDLHGGKIEAENLSPGLKISTTL